MADLHQRLVDLFATVAAAVCEWTARLTVRALDALDRSTRP